MPSAPLSKRVLRAGLGFVLLGLMGWSCSRVAMGQQPAANRPQDESTVTLNFAQEIPLQALVDYVSDRLKIKILYDSTTVNKKICVKAPGSIPVDSLLGVLESALRMNGLALVDADVPGWKRIVSADKLPSVARPGEAAQAIEQYGKGTAVTQTFVLKNAAPQQAEQIIKPFLTQPGGNCIVLPESRTLIVTDFAANVLNLAHLIEMVDQPGPELKMEPVPVTNIGVTDLLPQITAIFAAKTKAEGAAGPKAAVELIPDVRTNQILVIGQAQQIDEAKELIRSLDIPLKLVTKTYAFKNASAASIDRVAKQLIAPEAVDRLYRSVVDTEGNLLIVTATDDIHRQIEELRVARDIPTEARAQSPICFYKVKNLPVAGVLETIRSIERDFGAADPLSRQFAPLPTNGRIRPARERPVPGPNYLPPEAGSTELPTPPAVAVPPSPAIPSANGQVLDNPAAGVGGVPVPGQATSLPPAVQDSDAKQLLGQARVTADLSTNTLIVVAEPRVQRLYADLIKWLDQRRPQVLIEAKLVILDATDDFSLGVEISGGKGTGLRKLFAFTSYGLSTVDAKTGALALIPGVGFNGTLVDPDVADVVVKALASNSRARVLSAPRVLVNDNEQGQLSSVQEVPFTSVNASQTVATTSFAGFAEAGTTITVTPRISDDSHIELDFSITLNSFNGTGSNGVPPPRTTEEVTSQVTVPDGHTVIVGGLRRNNVSVEQSGIPGLQSVPVLRYILGSETKSKSCTSMFVFIRPVILRDDKFRDLKFVSERDVRAAGEQPHYPESKPIWVR